MSSEDVRRMQKEAREYLIDLCRLASAEQDPERLIELVGEINRLLDEKQPRSSQSPGPVEKRDFSSPPQPLWGIQ